MTFNDWWKTLTTREQARTVKGDVAEAWNAAVTAEREACARVCETLSLTIEAHKYPSSDERHLMAVAEAGCRGAFANAIRMRSNAGNERTAD